MRTRNTFKQYHYLYRITNLVNQKIYIGIHSTDNLNDGYFGSGVIIRKAIKYHGKENFIIEILEWFDWRCEAANREEHIVNYDFIKRCDTYNCKIGGSSQPMLCEKTRNLIRHAKVGKPTWNKGTVGVCKAPNKGIPHNDYTKAKMRMNHSDVGLGNNPRSRKCYIFGKIYECAKDAFINFKPDINYQNFCTMLRTNKNPNCYYLTESK